MDQSTASGQLRVRLLGRVEATMDAAPIRIAGRHAQALFALLVLDRRQRSREAIGTDLWPDGGAGSAGGLRQGLWLLRSALGAAGIRPEEVLDVDGDRVGLRAGAAIQTDVEVFERAARGPAGGHQAAIDAYAGDLLETLGNDCFIAERERLADLFEDVLAAAAADRLAGGDFGGARDLAERLLVRDPLREEAHAVLISVHGLVGSRSQVVRQYRRLRSVLARELAVEPLPETERAYREAMTTTVRRSGRAAALHPMAFATAGRAGPAPHRPSLRAVAGN